MWERIVPGLGPGTVRIWELNVGLFLQSPVSHRTQSKDIVESPSPNWLLWEWKAQFERLVFLTLGHAVSDFSFISVKTLPCLVLRETDPWLFF